METVLRCLCANNPASWSTKLPWVEYAINIHTAFTSKLSPFECCLGYQPPLFPSQEQEVRVSLAEAFIRRCKRTWRVTRTNLVKATARMKEQADKRRRPAPTYRVGQRVDYTRRYQEACTSIRGSLFRYPRHQSHSRPPEARRVYPTSHVSSLKPAVTHALCSAPVASPPSCVIDGGETFKVNKLMDCHRRGRGLQYLVDWEGYGPEHRAWTPARFILNFDPGLSCATFEDDKRRLLAGGGYC